MKGLYLDLLINQQVDTTLLRSTQPIGYSLDYDYHNAENYDDT